MRDTQEQSRPGPSRPDIVDLANDQDIDLWMRSLGVSREDLERAVNTVGPSAGDVYDFLARDRLHGTSRGH